MPAHIRIDGGLFSGRICWIEKQVVSIGSGAGCEVLVPDPDFPDSAITLEYRRGKYYLFGQQGVSIDVGGKVLPQLSEYAWSSETTLRVNGSVHLTIVVDPTSPEPRPVASLNNSPSAEDTIEPGFDLKGPIGSGGPQVGKPKKKFPILESVVIGVCGLGMAFMLLAGGDSKKAEEQGSESVDFDEVRSIAGNMSAHTEDLIRRAEIAFRHGRFEEADVKFRETMEEVRRYSVSQPGTSASGPAVSEDELSKFEEFLNSRISETVENLD